VISLHVTCGLTACTPGSAPGPTLGNEYGKTLPLLFTAVAVFPSVTQPFYTVSPSVSCPNPNDFLILDYFNSDFFRFGYPTSGNLALKGSGGELALLEPPYQIVLYVQMSFTRITYSVKNTASITTTFTTSNEQTVTTQRATIGGVSLSRLLS